MRHSIDPLHPVTHPIYTPLISYRLIATLAKLGSVYYVCIVTKNCVIHKVSEDKANPLLLVFYIHL